MIDLEKLYNEKFMNRADKISNIAHEMIVTAEEDVKKAIESGDKLETIYVFDYKVDENDITEVKAKLLTIPTQLQIAGISPKTLRFSFTPKRYQTSLNNVTFR